MTTKPETMNLKVKLNREELDQRRDKIATLVQHKIDVENAKKDSAAVFGKKINKIGGEMALMAQEIRERSEYRDVEVHRMKDYATGIERVMRVDTGESVDSRPLRPEEKQMSMSGINEGGPPTILRSVPANGTGNPIDAEFDEDANQAAIDAAAEAAGE